MAEILAGFEQKVFFGAVEFKFEPNMTVIIKNLAQKVDFWANSCCNQVDCRNICAGGRYGSISFLFKE